ncbi:MAG: hypothetical protein CBE47_00470 [Pelagibacteraceae bacterium TMED287]|nr:MAG: hypothetical protein CBE47_00470 [Pelagibacteraceae bacterium TMED287]
MSKIILTKTRNQINDLDTLPIYDRSLVDYSKYNKNIGHAGVKYSMAVQATRGCPYRCFYCDVYKTTLHHFRRSVDSIYEEVKMIADMGVKRIEFIDDIFNVKAKDFVEFFNRVIKDNLKVSFFFPTALKGDLLTKEVIDVMMQGGAVGVNVSLESASPRMQKVMRKNLNIEKFRENLEYLCSEYPEAVTTLNTMHGFPTETEEEAMMTLDFILSLKWVHFPYTHIVRIFPGTDLEKFALNHGVPRNAINESIDKSYHKVTPTLPFSREFTERYKLTFLKKYVLNKERLLKVLPVQMKHFTEDELNQRYSSYFPSKVKGLRDVLKIAGISEKDLKINCLKEEEIVIPELKKNIKKNFPKTDKNHSAFKILLINISTHFTNDKDISEYDVLEPPLGLIALQSYLNRSFKEKINGQIIKSRVDFDSYDELNKIVKDFNPDLIGVSSMTFHKDFFHEAILKIRQKGYNKMIVAGGPHPTTSYNEVLKDKNIDVCVIGEGEVTITDIIKKAMIRENSLLTNKDLNEIDGVAYNDIKKDRDFSVKGKKNKDTDSSSSGLYTTNKIIGQY